MDRRNGGDPLAPPRPPKLLPRVHRPRAPEPTSMMSSGSSLPELMHCTNHSSSSSSNNNHSQQTSNRNPSGNSNSNNNNNNNSSSLSNNSNNNSNDDNRNSNSNVGLLTPILSSSSSSSFSSNSSSTCHHHQQTSLLTTPLLQQHMQQQQQSHASATLSPSTTTTLNRNNSNLSSSSAISCVNSFTRRRPQPPLPLPPPPIVISVNLPLLTTPTTAPTTTGNFNSSEPVPISPVTLAAPRPESERLTNEYVDTPFRSTAAAQQLHQASRTQHPAGQTIHGQTTTQHNLLLQHSQRQQQLLQQHSSHQHHHQHQHYPHHHHQHVVSSSSPGPRGSTPAATTTTAATSPTTTTTIGMCDGGDIGEESLHSSTRSHKDAPATTGSTPLSPATTDAAGTIVSRTNLSSPLPIAEPIIKQPVSFTKDLPATMYHEEMLDLHHIGSGPGGAGTPTSGTGSTAAIINGSMVGGGGIGGAISGDSSLNPITCPRCDRCRCEQCQSPRQLPQTWVCNKTCLCSAETIIDYASCLCCVKALFYHCARDHEIDVCDDGDATLCVDDPCSCLPQKRGTRWGWLGALSLVLPCLWCYWPMRGCVAICAKCYARHAGHGCRCQTVGSTSSMLPIVPLGGGGIGVGGIGGALTDGNGRGVLGGINSVNPRKDCSGLGGGKSSGISGGVHSGISGSGNINHRHHHSDCSAANRILRKCDLTPEKRLLDSSAEY